jgi:hypothetical protein
MLVRVMVAEGCRGGGCIRSVDKGASKAEDQSSIRISVSLLRCHGNPSIIIISWIGYRQSRRDYRWDLRSRLDRGVQGVTDGAAWTSGTSLGNGHN